MESRFNKFLNQSFIKIDIYGEPIGLYYRGEKTFKTKVGACATVLTFVILLVYISMQLKAVVQQDYTISRENHQINEFTDQTIYNASTDILDYVFQFDVEDNKFQNFLQEPWRYIFAYANSLTQNERFIEAQNLPISCPEERYSEPSLGINLNSSLNETYYCFDMTSYKVYGSIDQDKYQYYNVKFAKCTQSLLDKFNIGGSCASDEEIETVISNTKLKILFMQMEFDEKNFTVPLQKQAKIKYFTYKSDLRIKQEVNVNKREVFLEESWLYSGFGAENYTTYTLDLNQLKVGGHPSLKDEQVVFEMIINKGFEEQKIKRTTETLVAIFSDLGGIMAFIQLSFSLLVASSSETEYYQAVLKQLFKYQKNMLKRQKKQAYESSSQFKGAPEHLFNRLMASIVNRAPVKFNLLQSNGRFNLCRKTSESQKLYEKEIKDQIEKYFSIDTLIKRTREASILASLILNKQQRILLPYLFQNIVLIKPRTGLKLLDDLNTIHGQQEDVPASQQELENSLEFIIKNYDTGMNKLFLKNLINLEESDFAEQLIMIDNLSRTEVQISQRTSQDKFAEEHQELKEEAKSLKGSKVQSLDLNLEDDVGSDFDKSVIIKQRAQLSQQRRYTPSKVDLKQ